MILCLLSAIYASVWYHSYNMELIYLDFDNNTFIEMLMLKFGSWALLFTLHFVSLIKTKQFCSDLFNSHP